LLRQRFPDFCEKSTGILQDAAIYFGKKNFHASIDSAAGK
jgi:hypothetical protein